MFKVKLLRPTSIAPTKAYPDDAAWDVYCDENEPVTLARGRQVKIRLGVALQLNKNTVALIQEKSGMATRDGIFTIGNVVDPGYTGEIHATCVTLYGPVTIQPGQKVAQMLVIQLADSAYEIVDALDEAVRGDRGFGSSGLAPNLSISELERRALQLYGDSLTEAAKQKLGRIIFREGDNK